MNIAYERMGTEFIAEICSDRLGKMIKRRLKNQKVGLEYVVDMQEATRLAVAYIDKSGNADYDFYGTRNEGAVCRFKMPEFRADDIFVFTSTAATLEGNRDYLKRVLTCAREKNVLVYYDPNVRISAGHKKNYIRNIKENISWSDIVRGSYDDFQAIFGAINKPGIWTKVKRMGVKILIITDGNEDVHFYSEYGNFRKKTKELNAVSTIGAGDAFNAGFVAALVRRGIKKENMAKVKTSDWQFCTGRGIDRASKICVLLKNYHSIKKKE
jgi:fructokinase